MIDKNDELYKDLEAVKHIPIVPNMLDVICRLTGMGFAAVARVTEDRWLACSVKDNVNFGLAEGGELEIKTTICNEIRDNHKEVVFDNASEHEIFKDHHTPKMYGLQSYISFPIILKNGEFFGTLCAIDSKPAHVDTPEIRGTFKLFTELLAFHLQSVDLIGRSETALKKSDTKLGHVSTENEVYKKISSHNIQEQVRKISLYSDMLSTTTEFTDLDKIRQTASRVNAATQELNSMMQQVTKYNEIENAGEKLTNVDLNEVVSDVYGEMADDLKDKNISVKIDTLPVISGIKSQLREVSFQLLNHAMLFSGKEVPVSINIFTKEVTADEVEKLSPEDKDAKFCEIVVEQKGIGIDEGSMKNIFDLFLHLSDRQSAMKYGAGLAYSRKVVQNHGGVITASPIAGSGISFSMILPSAS